MPSPTKRSGKSDEGENKAKKPKLEESKSDVKKEQKPEKPKEAATASKSSTSVSEKCLDVAGFYALEDRLASESGPNALVGTLKENAVILKQQLRNIIDGKPVDASMMQLMLATAAVKRGSRLAYYGNAALKKDLSTRLETVETKYMQLQNVSSEIGHLRKEIARCLEFPSNDERIPLVPVEEFYEKAKPEISKPEATRADAHAQRVARLNFERQQRRQLVSTLQELDARRSLLNSDINGKEQRLKSLKPKIEALIKAARPVQDVLGVRAPSSSTAANNKSSVFALLPPELSVLYVQAEAYKDIAEDAALSVLILGDTAEAMRQAGEKEKEEEERKTKGKEEEKGGDSDGEGSQTRGDKEVSQEPEPMETGEEREDTGRSRKSVSALLEKKRATLTKPHPVYLSLEIGCPPEDVKIRLKLQFLPQLKLCTLRWKISGKLPSFGGICDSDGLLEELFPGDDGLTCPNAVAAAKLDQLKLSLSSLGNKLGRPYKFVQSLTGCGGEGITGGTRLADEVQCVVEAVRQRVSSRAKLAKTVKSLDAGKASDLLSKEGLVREGKPITVLRSAKLATQEQFMSAVSESAQQEAASASFYVLFSFDAPHKIKLSAWCALPPSYPKRPPVWILQAQKGDKTVTSEDSVFLKELESLVGAAVPSSEGASEPDDALLLKRLHIVWTMTEKFPEEETRSRREGEEEGEWEEGEAMEA